MDNNKMVYCVWSNEETGGLFRCQAYPVNENTVIALFDDHIEVHLVKPTEHSQEFLLVYASNPMFYVGDNWQVAMDDIRNLSLAEFAAKYVHSDFLHLTLQE